MRHPGYTLLGWVVWQVGRRAARRKLAANRTRLAALAVVGLAVAVGVAAAAGSGGEDG